MAITYTITQSGASVSYALQTGVGPAGPNNVTTSTGTNLTGILKGDGANVSAAVANTDFQQVVEVKSDSFTAENSGSYHVVATATVTDPSPVEGKGFRVFVRNGTVTVGGTEYSTAGTIIERVYHSGSWSPNYVYLNKAQSDAAYAALAHTHVSADVTDATASATPDTLVKRNANGGGVSFWNDGGNAVFGYNTGDGKGVSGSSVSGSGGYFASSTGSGAVSTTGATNGYHHEFGTAGDDRSFVQKTFGLLGWWRGAFKQTIGSPASLGADRAVLLPDASGNVALTAQTDGTIRGTDLDYANTTDIGEVLTDADEVFVSDGGGNTTRVKAALSRFWTYVKAKIESVTLNTLTVSGDLTVDTSTLKVDSANNRVGIGTASPLYALHVSQSTNGGAYTRFENPNTGNAATCGFRMSAGANVSDGDAVYEIMHPQAHATYPGEFHYYVANAGPDFVWRRGVTKNMTLESPTGNLSLHQGNINFPANSGTWDGATIAGAQTFTGQLEATGQAATTDDSLMTRGLGDARYAFSQVKVKASSTSRSSTTTLSDDPDLVVTFPTTGIYRCFLKVATYDNSTGGFKYDLAGTATYAYLGFAHGKTISSSGTNAWGGFGNVTAPSEDVAPWANSTRILQLDFVVNVTVAGTMVFRWAQNTSSATNTTVYAGSILEISAPN